jgi:hypothetical protein
MEYCIPKEEEEEITYLNINIALLVIYLQRRDTKIEKGNRNKSERKRSIT